MANMWSAAGQRVSQQKNFQEKAPEEVRAFSATMRGVTLSTATRAMGAFKMSPHRLERKRAAGHGARTPGTLIMMATPIFMYKRVYLGDREKRSRELLLEAGGGEVPAGRNAIARL